MSDNLDRSLDEILEDKKPSNRNRRGAGGGNRPYKRQDRDRQDSYPRDGVRKTIVMHPLPVADANRSPIRQGAKIRVENIHYELTESELEDLFRKIGPVSRFNLCYDRAGRSEGVAFVTYQYRDDAMTAIQEYDGANANGQPIRLTLLPSDSGRRSRNPFDTAVMPSRPLAERITAPGDRDRSLSPIRRLEEEAARKGIDRYIPGRSNNRSRSPMRQRRGGGRRPGARRDAPRDQEGRGGQRSNARTKKTQEELDAEMEDYFTGGQAAQPAATATNTEPHDDIDMIE
ncbi:hypothetical protein jhhlp_001300 [Lomentospora prolificans]|uniref:RRM domain-containing protein n=1 Tax=Lomentospora prolificans TaxID=41688 RepID=A0A2N3NHU7_9PEZI|nr:hypothetical protein jhhlp_001300 [Lomentospora prolificans]